MEKQRQDCGELLEDMRIRAKQCIDAMEENDMFFLQRIIISLAEYKKVKN